MILFVRKLRGKWAGVYRILYFRDAAFHTSESVFSGWKWCSLYQLDTWHNIATKKLLLFLSFFFFFCWFVFSKIKLKTVLHVLEMRIYMKHLVTGTSYFKHCYFHITNKWIYMQRFKHLSFSYSSRKWLVHYTNWFLPWIQTVYSIITVTLLDLPAKPSKI